MQQEMETGSPFNIEFCTYDEKRLTGGELIKLGPAILTYRRKKTGGIAKKTTTPTAKKHRNNWHNETLTIRVKGSSRFITVHKQLITLFNNERVI